MFAAAHIGGHIGGHPTTNPCHGLNAPSPTGIAKFVKAQAAGILLRVKKKASEIHLQNGRDYHQHQLFRGILGDYTIQSCVDHFINN